MRKIFLFFAFIALASCEVIEYDGETRLVIEGKVVDKNQTPIPDTAVQIFAYRDNSYSKTDLISYANTNSSGNFQLLIPAPKGADDYLRVVINATETNQGKTFNSILMKDFSNYKLSLNPVVLYENSDLTQLIVRLNQVHQQTQISDVYISSGIQSEDVTEYNPFPLDYIPNELFYKVLRNQTINITYKITDYSNSPAVANEYTDSFRINNTETTYTINY